MTEETKKEVKETKAGQVLKGAKSDFSTFGNINPWGLGMKNWNYGDLSAYRDKYVKILNECRFFYIFDPLASTVLNKLVDVGISNILFSKHGLSDNEFRLYKAIKPKLQEFAESMAIEYLLSGLVVPEVTFGTATKEELVSFGVKKYEALTIPKSMWIRDPKTIYIKTTMISDNPTYYVEIPEETRYFIRSGGTYSDGTKDLELYELMVQYYPDFVALVKKGETKIPLDNPRVIRRRYLSDNPYPIPYMQASLESLKHKRHMRQMDYSIIDKVMGAIMHVKVGSDDFPITDSEEDDSYVESIRQQLNWRNMPKNDQERIFQFITSHAVEIKWVFPDIATLINDSKYTEINDEILNGLGFPRILITGESLRSGSSDPEVATRGPQKTLEFMRNKIIEVIRYICREVAKQNGFSSYPDVSFEALNLHSFQQFIEALDKLYQTGGLSRQSYGEYLGYDFETELEKRSSEQELLEKSGVPEVGPNPFGSPTTQQTTAKKPANSKVSGDNSNGNTNKQSK